VHHLELKNIVKDYPGVRALNGVSLHVRSGEILSICGENGAGKSTLMKIMSGVISAGNFSGEILLDQKPAQFHSLKESEAEGITIIHQELSIIPELSLAENIFLGHEKSFLGFLRKREMFAEAERLLAQVGLTHSPLSPASALSIGQCQLLEIAKALSQSPKFLILDEPTSALSGAEVDRLLDVLRKLKSSGVACLMISHKLDEVFSVADRILVLRDGASVAELEARDTTQSEVIRLMVGRELKNIYPEKNSIPREKKTPRLEVKNFTNAWVKDVSFSLHSGEVLGIAGLMGSGRSELLLSLFGAGPTSGHTGQLLLDGKPFKPKSPAHAAKSGIALVTEDRKGLGLMLEHPVLDNAALTPLGLGIFSRLGMILKRKRQNDIESSLRSLRLKSPSLATDVQNLSGGNQQKVVLGKWLLSQPRILFLDEPTRGIDVGARSEFYSLIRELANEGMAVIVVSSELPEVMGLADRLLVMNEGKVVYETPDLNTKPETIMAYATGASV
jgi:D-xylose transport system ATP-binding protein